MQSIPELLRIILGERTHKKIEHVARIKDLSVLQVSELQGLYGLTSKEAAKVRATIDFGRELGQVALKKGDHFTSSRVVAQHFRPLLKDLLHEEFWTLYLDGKHRTIESRMIHRGTLTACPVHPREILGPALRMGAAAMVIIHNHPSGETTPSGDDLDITRRITDASNLFGVRLIDHVIVGEDGHTSLADSGLMN